MRSRSNSAGSAQFAPATPQAKTHTFDRRVRLAANARASNPDPMIIRFLRLTPDSA
jgi:hypothetical protein